MYSTIFFLLNKQKSVWLTVALRQFLLCDFYSCFYVIQILCIERLVHPCVVPYFLVGLHFSRYCLYWFCFVYLAEVSIYAQKRLKNFQLWVYNVLHVWGDHSHLGYPILVSKFVDGICWNRIDGLCWNRIHGMMYWNRIQQLC